MTRVQELKAQLAAIERELAAEEVINNLNKEDLDYGDSVLRMHGLSAWDADVSLSYAAICCKGFWYLTGTMARQPLSWVELLDWMRDERIFEVAHATEWADWTS